MRPRTKCDHFSYCGQPPLTFITPTKCRQKPKSTCTKIKPPKWKTQGKTANGGKNIIKNKHYAATDNGGKKPRKTHQPKGGRSKKGEEMCNKIKTGAR